MKRNGWPVGMGQKQNPFLQIPLKDTFHVGDFGIDSGYGVERWEKEFGEQMEHLEWVDAQLEYSIFEEAQRWQRENRRNTGTKGSSG